MCFFFRNIQHILWQDLGQSSLSKYSPIWDTTTRPYIDVRKIIFGIYNNKQYYTVAPFVFKVRRHILFGAQKTTCLPSIASIIFGMFHIFFKSLEILSHLYFALETLKTQIWCFRLLLIINLQIYFFESIINQTK